jgi:hypothetical protein
MHHDPKSLIHYDTMRRRLWIRGQRCHHGATGALLTCLAATGVVTAQVKSRALLALVLTGSVLMAHDWHDRSMWFERGWGDQP